MTDTERVMADLAAKATHGVCPKEDVPPAQLVMADLAAKAIGLDKFYLYRLAATGQIPHFRSGRAVRFSIPELLEWMRDNANVKASGSANGHGSQKEEL